MRAAILLLLMSSSAGAVPLAQVFTSQTMEALKAEGVRDPAADPRSEDAARRAGQGFEGNPFHIKALSPVEYVPVGAGRVSQPGPAPERPAPPRKEPAAEVPAPGEGTQRSPNNNYYFEGSSPVQGITIYKAKPDLNGD